MTARLSPREAQVLRGMSYGLFRKLGAIDRANAVRLGFEHGYLTVTPTPVVTTRALEAYL